MDDRDGAMGGRGDGRARLVARIDGPGRDIGEQVDAGIGCEGA